jgi:hypothetical protein
VGARPALAGRAVTIWVDETSLHGSLGGVRLKTVPASLGVIELAGRTIGDPGDEGVLNVAGLDGALPKLIGGFLRS